MAGWSAASANGSTAPAPAARWAVPVTTLIEAATGQVGGAVQSLIWQPILMDVRSMRVRGWVNNSWMGGSQLQAYTSRSNESGGQDKNDPYGNSAYPNLPAITPTTPPEVAENIRAARRIADEQQDRMGLSGIEVLIERTNGQRFLRIYSIRD
mgnify:CR=1 FL=1